MNGIEPKLERSAGFLERGSYGRVQVVATPLAGIGALRLNAEPFTLALAFRALEALSKANIEQVLEAGFIVRKLAEELGGGEWLRHAYCIAGLVTYGKGIHPQKCH